MIPEGKKRAEKESEMTISKELLDILACPKCKGDITLNKAGDGLICKACHLLYQIRDDIPVMLIDISLSFSALFFPSRIISLKTL